MRWQCQYIDAYGKRCEAEALHRLHFSEEHPFNHVDTCAKHFEEYKNAFYVQDIHEYGREYLNG